MAIQDYFDKNKQEWFPGMDFKDPQDQLRKLHPNDMTFNQWIWFSPILYNLQLIGVPIFNLILFNDLIIWAIFNRSWFTLILSVIVVIVLIKQLITKIDGYKYTNDMNLYDNFLREY